MRGALDSLDDEEITVNFLRHALIVQRGYLRESEVYQHVQQIVRSEQSAVTFAANLEHLANTYVATFNPEHESWNDYPGSARRAIEVFNLLNIRPFRPLILAVAARFSQGEATAAFSYLVSLGVRLLIASSTRSGSVEVPLAQASQAIWEQRTSSAKQLATTLEGITPTDVEFREAFEGARVSNARLARYYPRSLEMQAMREPDPWFIPQADQSVINLEHVLPKRPEGNWPQFTEDEVRLYSTRIGNLALLRATDNSDLRSAGFEDKRAVFAQSPYVLTKQIAAADGWTKDSIADRQRKLAEIAVEAWPARV